MLRPQGHISIVGGWKDQEFDTIQCGHCQQVVIVKPGTANTVYLLPQRSGPPTEEPGAFCRQCMRAICVTCCDDGRCTPFMRQIEAMEGDRLARNRLGMG